MLFAQPYIPSREKNNKRPKWFIGIASERMVESTMFLSTIAERKRVTVNSKRLSFSTVFFFWVGELSTIFWTPKFSRPRRDFFSLETLWNSDVLTKTVKNSKLGRAADFFSKSQFTITTEKYNFPKSRIVQFLKIVLNGLRRPQINYEIVVSNYEK